MNRRTISVAGLLSLVGLAGTRAAGSARQDTAGPVIRVKTYTGPLRDISFAGAERDINGLSSEIEREGGMLIGPVQFAIDVSNDRYCAILTYTTAP